MSEARDGEARAADGTRLWYRVIDAPSGTPLVLANGAACTIQYWPLLVEYFAGRVPLVLFDYRGHGRSGRAPHETYEVPSFARDLLAVLDAAGIERATLAGHSMGVQVVVEAYRTAPERAAALVALFGAPGGAASAVAGLPGGRKALERVFAALVRHAGPVGAALKPLLTTPPAVIISRLVGSNLRLCPERYVRALLEHIRTIEPEALFRAVRSAAFFSVAEVLPEVRVPALVFAGARDKMTPPALAERMVRVMPGAELAVVEHGSHLAMLENPGYVHCRLELFLRDHGLMEAPGKVARGAARPAAAVAGKA